MKITEAINKARFCNSVMKNDPNNFFIFALLDSVFIPTLNTKQFYILFTYVSLDTFFCGFKN